MKQYVTTIYWNAPDETDGDNVSSLAAHRMEQVDKDISISDVQTEKVEQLTIL